MAVDFSLYKRGFIAPSYEEILEGVIDDFEKQFGNDIVLTSNSNAGIFARMIAWRETLLIQELQKTYFSGFISTATESSLDRIGANLDLPRKVAMPSHAEVEIKTEEEYLIEAGEEFETEDGIIFELIDDVITKKSSDGGFVGYGYLESEDRGDFTNVNANTITILSTPNEDILSVTNPEKAGGGQDYESDSDYRTRLILENVAKPGPTEPGIKSALLNLPGVRDVNIVDNSDGEIDSYDNDPYSVHVYVLGGDKTDIATTLVNTSAAGIKLVGSESVTVDDTTGTSKTVNFDFAKDKNIYVSVKLRTTNEWNADDGVDDVKQVISDYINSLKIGNSVTLTRIYPSIYSIEGVGEAIVRIGSDKDHLQDEDVSLEPFEAPKCDLENIEVTINGV